MTAEPTASTMQKRKRCRESFKETMTSIYGLAIRHATELRDRLLFYASSFGPQHLSISGSSMKSYALSDDRGKQKIGAALDFLANLRQENDFHRRSGSWAKT
jgi:hypothetical protein